MKWTVTYLQKKAMNITFDFPLSLIKEIQLWFKRPEAGRYHRAQQIHSVGGKRNQQHTKTKPKQKCNYLKHYRQDYFQLIRRLSSSPPILKSVKILCKVFLRKNVFAAQRRKQQQPKRGKFCSIPLPVTWSSDLHQNPHLPRKRVCWYSLKNWG